MPDDPLDREMSALHMEQVILDRLEGPSRYDGFTVCYVPLTAPPSGTVQVGVHQRTRTGENLCHFWVEVHTRGQVPPYQCDHPIPILEGETYYLISGINQRPAPVDGLRARFIQPDA